MTSEPEEPDYREVRRWCIQEARPLGPADLQRQFRIGYSRAAGLLEELQRDRVLRKLQDGRFTAQPPGSTDAAGLQLRPRSLRHGRNGDEACEACGWSIPHALRAGKRSSGCHDHHVVPVSRGGGHEASNRIRLCPNHHALAHALFPLYRKSRYRGPATRDELLVVLRQAEADPDLFVAQRLAPTIAKLRDAPGADWQEVPDDRHESELVKEELWTDAPPRDRQRRETTSPPEAIPLRVLKRHMRERHACALEGCERCGVGSVAAVSPPAEVAAADASGPAE